MPTGSGGKTPTSGDFLLNRPFSDNGLPTGSINLADANGSVTPIDYYIEALSGERLSVARVVVFIQGAGNIASGEYGDIAGGLTNGVDLILRVKSGDSFVNIKASNGLPVKINEHWGRWCYDSEVVTIGAVTPYFRVRWTFSNYGVPIFLDEGERLVVRVNDDLTSLVDHTIIAEGVHCGTPNPIWQEIIT